MAINLLNYEHLLLDMNGTFVFGFDRFGPDQDYGKTFQQAGHRSLSPPLARQVVHAAYTYMAARYEDEAFYTSFPSVEQAIRATAPPILQAAEVALTDVVMAALVDTFTRHELGWLPNEHREALGKLAAHKPLSVLSNLWSPKDRWLQQFEAWDIARHFTHLHFSSDGVDMKPHPGFFERALAALQLSPKQVLYIGDSYRCDVLGARAAGMDVVWLTEETTMPSQSEETARAASLPVLVAEVFEK